MSQEVQGMLIRLEATTAQLRQEMAKADSTVAQVSGRIDLQLGRVDSAFDRVGHSAQAAGNMVKNALGAAVGAAGISELLKHAEAYTTIANRLKLVTSNAAEFTAAQNSVFAIAQRSGQPLTATAELYQRIAQNQKELKLSGQGVANIVETISKTMVISGASTESANAALIQLGQAFASGVLRGEELNSVLEQAPALAQAIAKGMGVSVGALRSLGAAGKLTADSVVAALQAQAGAVDKLFGKMQNTVSQGMTKLDNSATNLIGKLDQATGVSQQLSGVLTSMSKSLDAVSADGASFADTVQRVTNVAETLAVVIGSRLALSAGQAVLAFAAATKASIEQAIATERSIVATDRALVSDAASARQTLITAQSRQVDAKAMLERANVELASAEQKVASDRIRQASEVANLQSVQAALVAERSLEEQRLKAQITDTGRAQSVARLAELRQSEVAIINQVKTAEVSLAETTAATSAQIQAAYKARSVAAGAYGETALAVNQAVALSDKATAAASVTSRAVGAVSTAGSGLLGLMTGPVGLIATAALVAASFVDFGSSADTATKALIDQHATIDESIKKFDELGAAQRRYQLISWAEEQKKSLETASESLQQYSAAGAEAFLQIGYNANGYRSQFKEMIEEVRKGQRTLDSVTEWAKTDAGLTDEKIKKLAESSSEYEKNAKRADELGKILNVVSGATAATTVETGKLAAAQQSSGMTDANKVAWEKYIEQLTKTRDLLGANASAEAAYTAAKMGATPIQAAQAKAIADQTDTLKKYQEAIKQGAEAEKIRLKAQLVALYTAEDAANAAAEAQKKALDETAKAAELSASRQVSAMQTVIDQTMRVVSGQNLLLVQPQKQNLSGYGLLTNGGTAPVVATTPAVPKATPLDRATAAVAQLDATTEANKRVDKAANEAARALKAQEKALTDLLAKSGIATKASNDIADSYLAGADNVRALIIRQEIEQEVLKTGAAAYDKVRDAINAMHDAKDREDVSKTVATMRAEVEWIQKEVTATLQGTDALEAYNVEKSVKAELAGKNIAVGSEEYRQLVATTKAQLEANKALEQAGKVDGIVDRLNPQIKLLKDYTEEQDALNAAIARYPENAGLYRDALTKLGNEYEVNRSKATIWGQMTEAAIDRIDGVFASAWGNIGDGAESLWTNLKKGFKQTLGEIAHMLTTKPLLASISNWLTGTDNGQGLGSVWSKILSSVGGSSSSGVLSGLLGSTSSSSSSSGGGLGGAVGMLKDAYSAYSSASGVGSAIVSGYASGGISGAISGGVGYYSSMLSSLGTTITGGISSVVSAIASSTAATTAAQFTSAGVVSGAFAQVGATLATSTTTTAASLAPVYGQAAMQLGQAATPQIVGAGSGSAFAAWPLLVLMGMYQSGKLYDAGVRPDGDNLQATGGDTALGKAAMFGPATGARWLEFKDNLFSKVVGGKIAAMITGSTVFQAVYEKVGAKLFGSAYETKDSGIALGVTDGGLNAQQYVDQKKKGGWISGSTKKRTLYGELADEAEYGLQGTYMATQIGVAELVSRIGISVTDGAFDGLQIAQQKISTQDKTQEEIKTAVDAWFVSASDAMIAALDGGSGGFGYSFEELARRINVFESFNASINMINLGVLDLSANSMELANALVIASGNSEQFNTNISGYYDKFFSETEKADDVLEAVNKQFAAMNITFPSSREEYRKLVESITDLNSAEGQKMFLSLTYAAGMASDAYDILEQRATDATAATKALADSLLANVDTAMSAVSKAVSAEQNALTEAYNARATSLNDMLSTAQGNVSDLTSVSSSLSEALKALNGTSDETVRMLRNQAQATLQSALATVRAGGTLANMTGFDDALDVVSRNTTDLYSSLEDFNRDQGRTANVVAELNNINGVQLSTQEQLLKTVQDQIDAAKEQYDDQMKALDDQLALAQAQVDALNGIDNSVLSVKDAIAGLGAAIAAAMANAAGAKGAASTASSAVTSYTGSGGAPSQSDLNAIYQQVLGRDADFAGLSYWSGVAGGSGLTAAQLASQIQADAIKNGEIQAHAAGGLITGPGTGTSDSILSRLSNGEYVMRAAAVSAYGTDMLDQMNSLRMPVGENGPTLEVTAPSRVFSASQSSALEGGGSTAQLEQKVDVLIDVVKQIVGPMKLNSDENSKLMKKWDRIGLPTKQVKEGA